MGSSDPGFASLFLSKYKIMSDQLDIRKQKVLDLKKAKGMDGKAQVVVAMDFSGSMGSLYSNGAVQTLVERLFPLALGFDDNEELDFYLFDNGYKELSPVTRGNYSTYIHDYVHGDMGGTSYAPVLNAIAKKKFTTGGLFGFGAKEVPIGDPVYVIFITDGDNSDPEETKHIMRALSRKGIFIQFVGIGHSSFSFLEKLDDLDGRLIDNCNFFSASDISSVSDEYLYDKLLTEFPEWIVNARAHNLIK